MKSIKLILLATAALAVALTIQQQNVAAFNDNNVQVSNGHDHQSCDSNGVCSGDTAGTFNTANVHNSFNCNDQRAGDQCNVNSHTKPANN